MATLDRPESAGQFVGGVTIVCGALRLGKQPRILGTPLNFAATTAGGEGDNATWFVKLTEVMIPARTERFKRFALPAKP